MQPITITDFGLYYLVGAVVSVFFRQPGLLTLLIVSTVLQAPAVVTVTVGGASHGITPFNVCVGFVSLALLVEFWRVRSRLWTEISVDTRRLFVSWLAFLSFSSVAALLLPLIFDGMPVHPALKLGDVGFETEPLRLNLGNFASAVNSFSLLVVLCWCCVIGHRRDSRLTLIFGFAFALATTAVIGLYQRGAYAGWYQLASGFWGSNPTYNQWFHQPGYGPSFGRAALPFVEPSYASVWFAAVACGAYAVLLFSHLRALRRSLWLVAYGVSIACLINAAATTGFAVAAFGVIGLSATALCVKSSSPTHFGRRLAIIIICLVSSILLCAYFDWIYFQSATLMPLRSLIEFNISKLQVTPWTLGPRIWSTQRALEIVWETYGLGVGSGSTRSSSYFVSLLACNGIIGFALFSRAFFLQVTALVTALADQKVAALSILVATVACFTAAAGAISDQSWPVLWVFVCAGVILSASRATKGSGGGVDAPCSG